MLGSIGNVIMGTPLKRAVGGDVIRYPLKGQSGYSVETSQMGTQVYPESPVRLLLQ